MRYFQGNSVHGPVRESPASSFREVVDALRLCPVLGLTRASFFALDKRKRNETKQVPFFVPAAFAETPSKRLYSLARQCNLLFLDIDEQPDGKCPAAPFVRNPETLHTALAGLNFAAHTTASSTPEKPRMRIVVEADAIPVERYAAAVTTIGKRLGLTRVTTESKVAVQPMFLPVLFSDTGEAEHPLIAHETESSPFCVADITEQAETPEFRVPRDAGGSDSLDFLRAPVEEITLPVATDALDTIDPDCSYHEWLEVAAALRHQFARNPDAAYTLFDDWSSRGAKYGGTEETRAKWDSLRPTPVGRVPVTIRSLLRQAAAAGWDDTRTRENCFTATSQWIDGVATFTELLDQGVKRIMGTPLLSAMQEDVLIGQLCLIAKQRFVRSISTTTVRRDIARLRGEMRTMEKAPEKKQEPPWAKTLCYISATQEFFRHRSGEKYRAEALNACYGRKLLPTEEMLREAGLPVTPATLSKPVVEPSAYALNHLKIPTVYDYAYDPSQPAEMFFVNRGRRYVNTYRASHPEPNPARAGDAGDIFQSHLCRLIGERHYRRIITDYLAYHVQSPGRKIRWAPLVQGVEGAGKTFLAQAAKAVLGAEHVRTISGEAVKKGWNEWSFGAQMVIFEEVRVAGTNRYEIMNALKPLITDDGVSVNERNRNTRETANTSNYMLFSNHHDALALTPGDRRYFVVKSPLQHKAQVLALGEDYFTTLFAMLRDNAGGLRAYLLEWEISSGFNPDGHAPRTTYVEEMVNDSASDASAATRRLLLEGDYPLIQFDIVSAKMLHDVLLNEEGLRITPQQVAHVLREEGMQQFGRHRIAEERHYLWVRPGVGDVVATVEERVRLNLRNLCMEVIYG